MKRKAALYYVLPLFRAAVNQLKHLESSEISFLFPVKSFTHPAILSEVAAVYSGFDVSNLVEYELIAPFLNPSHVTWNSSPVNEIIPGVTFNDINSSDALGAGSFTGSAIRINPDFLGTENRFGIASAKAKELLKQHPSLNAIHIHLSGIKNSRQDFSKLISHVSEMVRETKRPLKINLGGGFSQLTYEELGEVVAEAKQKLAGHQLFFEPGRWLAKQCGFAVGRVLSVEDRRIATSLSAACHLRWMDIDCKISFNRPIDGEDAVLHKVYGPTCFENDLVGGVLIPEKRITTGDLISLDKISGYAYGWNHAFNGIAAADIVLFGA